MYQISTAWVTPTYIHHCFLSVMNGVIIEIGDWSSFFQVQIGQMIRSCKATVNGQNALLLLFSQMVSHFSRRKIFWVFHDWQQSLKSLKWRDSSSSACNLHVLVWQTLTSEMMSFRLTIWCVRSSPWSSLIFWAPWIFFAVSSASRKRSRGNWHILANAMP